MLFQNIEHDLPSRSLKKVAITETLLKCTLIFTLMEICITKRNFASDHSLTKSMVINSPKNERHGLESKVFIIITL